MRLISILLAIGATTVGLAACDHHDPAPTTAPSPTANVAPPFPLSPKPLSPKPHLPVSMFGDGRYEVLTDIAAGEYKATGPVDRTDNNTDKCYWARLKDFTGTPGSVIAMQYGNHGPDIVVIEPADKGFETRDCGTWTLVTLK